MDLPKRAFIRPILESLTAVMKKYPWTELQKLQGDQVTLDPREPQGRFVVSASTHASCYKSVRGRMFSNVARSFLL